MTYRILFPFLIIIVGSLGCLMTLLSLGPILNPPLDWESLFGATCFGTLSVCSIRLGLKLWKQNKLYVD